MPNSAQRTAWQRLYKTPEWRALRREQLRIEPCCRFCDRLGITRAAAIVDHVEPHRGSRRLFFDPGNLQSLCKHHHDQLKQSWEKRGTPEIGADGWPVDDDRRRRAGTAARPQRYTLH